VNQQHFSQPRIAAPLMHALACAAIAMSAGPTWGADPGRGQQVYTTHCAQCHGEGGHPVWPGTPDFKRTTVLLKPDSHLVATIQKGRGAMPAYAGVIRDREMPDLIAYLRTLR